MGNQSSKVEEAPPDEALMLPEATATFSTASVSSNSMSERSHESRNIEAADGYCSTAASACIPSVLSFRGKMNNAIESPTRVEAEEHLPSDPLYEAEEAERVSPFVMNSLRLSALFSSSIDQTTPIDDSPPSSGTPSLRTFGLRKRPHPTTNGLVAPIPEYPYAKEEADLADGDLATPESDLSRPRDYWIVTTAALPWMTGTAVNPLLRAAYLSQYNRSLARTTTAIDSNDQASSSEEATLPLQQPASSIDRSTVTLVLPWLESAYDREELYGPDWRNATPDEQEAYIRDWLSRTANMPLEARPANEGGIRILFYPARYHKKLSSIFAMGDLCEWMVKTAANATNSSIGNDTTAPVPLVCPDTVCILEEPEHVHFYRAQRWKDHFCHIVGIIHTNYKAYASSPSGGCFSLLAGSITGPFVATMSSLLVKAYCDQVIKLSPVLQTFAPEKETVCNVHGIRQDFITEGKRRAQQLQSRQEADDDEATPTDGDKIYFVGKLLFAKGFDKMLELESAYRGATGEYFPIDIYGSGPEEEEIQQAFLSERPRFFPTSSSNSLGSASTSAEEATSAAEKTMSPSSSSLSLTRSGSRMNMATTYYSTFVRPKPPVPARFLGRKDHAELTTEYKIFVNPSITEVLCTTTAEATAMGKFVIIPEHPSNEFFAQFPNCLMYRTKLEFVSFLQFAIAHDPKPLSDELTRTLTWEAATDRLIVAAAISRRDAQWRERIGKSKADEKIAQFHYELGKGARGDVIRKVLGGGPVADQFQYDCMLENDPSNYSSAPSLEVDVVTN